MAGALNGYSQTPGLGLNFAATDPDEATSSLDAHSEVLVQEALDKLMEGRTSIIIAHRLSTIKKVDRIFVIHEGTLAEMGSHAQLSVLDNGIYNNLLQLQLR